MSRYTISGAIYDWWVNQHTYEEQIDIINEPMNSNDWIKDRHRINWTETRQRFHFHLFQCPSISLFPKSITFFTLYKWYTTWIGINRSTGILNLLHDAFINDLNKKVDQKCTIEIFLINDKGYSKTWDLISLYRYPSWWRVYNYVNLFYKKIDTYEIYVFLKWCSSNILLNQ